VREQRRERERAGDTHHGHGQLLLAKKKVSR
jgi:hypothetical protein